MDRIYYLSKLLKIPLSNSEREEIKGDLEKLTDYFSKIKNVASSEKPLYSPLESLKDLRPDEIKPSETDLVDLSAESMGQLYKVPPVV